MMCTNESFDAIKSQSRNDLWDVLKGIGIFAVVVGHSGCPEPMQRFISAFHMPLFFMISGILLNELYFFDKRKFVKKRIISLYIPFIKWSVIFILLHNVFFYFGILNSTYGYAGDVDRWYSIQDIIYSLFVAAFSMNTFEHLLGAFWFIKALFVGSILFVFLGTKSYLNLNIFFVCIPILIWAFCIVNIVAIEHFPLLNSFEIRFVGHKELFGMFFISLGFMMKYYIHYLQKWTICAVCFIFLLTISLVESISMAPIIKNVLLLPVSAACGFIVCFNIGHLLVKRNNRLVNLLRNMGHFSFYILTFHFICFKIVSFFKIWLYDLDVAMVAEFPIVYLHNDYFWILYSLVGTLLSFELGKRIDRIPFFRR